MAETPNTPSGFPNTEKHNQKVASDLLNQDLINPPIELQTAGDALDKLAALVPKKPDAGDDAPEPKAKNEPEPKASNEPEPKAGAADPDPAADDAAKKAAEVAAAKATEDAALKESADKIFKDSPTLPANASPKSSEAFSSIKIQAARELAAREAEIEKIKKEKAELEEKLKTPIPPELEKELEDHRNWRAKLDVDADPKFKEFDKNISAAQEFIYAQLKKSPAVTADVIEQIKKYGGPEMVDLSKLFATVKDPTLQRMVESKLADIEMAKYQKDQAIKLAKDNIQQYVGERTKAFQANATHHTTATQTRLDGMVKQLDWFKEKPLDEKADATTKKEAEEHNKFVTETRQQLAAALQDDSADMRAILLTGMAQLFHLQRVHAGTTKALETTQKELSELTAKWEKVKNSSTSRLRESGATGGPNTAIKPADQFNTRPGDALDDIAKKVMEARANAGTTS
jgi:hypothetical protein